MKTINILIKIVVALAAVAGAVYVAATYGDKIVAWCKKLISGTCCCGCECEDGECCCECEDGECCCEEAAAEEAAAEEAAAEEAPVEEAPAVAESDFEG